MEDLLPLLVKSDMDPALHPRSYVMWEWAQIKRDLGSRIQTSSLAVEVIARLKSSTAWSQGVTGFLLAGSIQEFESLKDSDAVEYIFNLNKEWCDVAYKSRDHQAMSALCVLHLQLKLWDTLARMPEEYHLDCGHHLSRLGYPELAERFLLSDFSPCESHALGNYWRCQIELLAVTIRLGRWQEAEGKLHSSLQIAIRRCDNANFDAFGNWQLSGEFGEFKLSISCLLADCFMAKGKFLGAELLLRAPLEGIQDMRDHYIKSMRLAVQSQLLHAQLQLDYFGQAKETSL